MSFISSISLSLDGSRNSVNESDEYKDAKQKILQLERQLDDDCGDLGKATGSADIERTFDEQKMKRIISPICDSSQTERDTIEKRISDLQERLSK